MQLILGLFLAVRARRAGGLLGLLGQVGRLLLFLVLEVLSCGFINLKSLKNRTVRLKLMCCISSSSQLHLCYEITSIDNTDSDESSFSKRIWIRGFSLEPFDSQCSNYLSHVFASQSVHIQRNRPDSHNFIGLDRLS